jgi:hypothetical protein
MTFACLAELSRPSVTDPFELKLVHATGLRFVFAPSLLSQLESFNVLPFSVLRLEQLSDHILLG